MQIGSINHVLNIKKSLNKYFFTVYTTHARMTAQMQRKSLVNKIINILF